MAPQLLAYPPVYCSACWCSQPEKRHVDYAADNDQGYGNDPSHTVAYDNLQICEDCMKAGALLVGMVDAAERDQDIHRLMAENDRLKRYADQAQKYADTLEQAFDKRGIPIRVDHRKKPREIRPQEVQVG